MSFIVEPVPHPHMVITEPSLIGDGAHIEKEALRKVPLQFADAEVKRRDGQPLSFSASSIR